MPSLLIMNYVPVTGYPSVLPYMIYIIYDKSPEIFSWAALRRRRRRLRRGGGGRSHNSAKKAEGKDFHDHLRSLCVLQNFGLQPFCRRSTGGRCQAVSPKKPISESIMCQQTCQFLRPAIHSLRKSTSFSKLFWRGLEKKPSTRQIAFVLLKLVLRRRFICHLIYIKINIRWRGQISESLYDKNFERCSILLTSSYPQEQTQQYMDSTNRNLSNLPLHSKT